MTKRTIPSYFAVFIDHGHRGLEAVVQPELTRQDVISRIKSGEYTNIAGIHFVSDLFVDDVTYELIEAAEAALKMEAA